MLYRCPRFSPLLCTDTLRDDEGRRSHGKRLHRWTMTEAAPVHIQLMCHIWLPSSENYF